MTTDEMYMHRCIQLAKMGRAGSSPNPMVGAVIVSNGRIIGEGFHRRCGGPHAEVNAFNNVREDNLLTSAKMYVSLEPCSHWGRTPPCAKLIIEKGIKEVIVGCLDTFAKVNGEGIRMLQEAGIKVTIGVLEKECKELNQEFFTIQQKNRPYVILKWAQSADGFIDVLRNTGIAQRFSTSRSAIRVQYLRSITQAILIGTHTALLDNPQLTRRIFSSPIPYLRVVIDRHAVLPSSLNIFNDSAPTLIIGYSDNPTRRKESTHYQFAEIRKGDDELTQVLRIIEKQGVRSLLVEGGGALLQAFINHSLFDEIHIEHSPIQLKSGVRAPILSGNIPLQETLSFGARISVFTNTNK